MKPTSALFAAALAALLLAQGCATTTVTATGDAAAIEAERLEQARFAARTDLERRERLDRVSWPLLTANAEVCPQTNQMAGFNYGSRWELANLPPVYQTAMAELVKLHGDRFGIIRVTEGGPSAEAGLARGDQIVAIDGKAAPVVASKRAVARSKRKLESLLDAEMADGRVTLRVSRQSPGAAAPDLVDVDIELVDACAYPVVMLDDDALNAYADGNAVYITTGMLRFAATDLELQTVIAHELAHNTEGHLDKSRNNALIGGLLGAIVDVAAASQGIRTNVTGSAMQAGAQAFSQDFEREADYVGIYYMERAGIDATEAATFWRRMAAENARSVVYGRSHPTSPERFVNITAAAAEVREKREAGTELLPTRRNTD